jgi:ABC-type uncharacterized transport system fused permease/ATPase subunit
MMTMLAQLIAAVKRLELVNTKKFPVMIIMLVLLIVVVLLLAVNMKLLFALQFPVKLSLVILLMDANIPHMFVMTMMLVPLILVIVILTAVLTHLLIVTIMTDVPQTSVRKDYVTHNKKYAMIMTHVQPNIVIAKQESASLKSLSVTITIYVPLIPASMETAYIMKLPINVTTTIFAQ